MLSDAQARVDAAIAALRHGRPVILVDDALRENEGDLVVAAEKVTPEIINFLIKNGSGIICLCLSEEKVHALSLPLMVSDESLSRPFSARFTVSIEAREGITTGVSAADRATTIKAAIKDDAKPQDLCRPGHVFPLQASKGGLSQRQGHTEGSIALTELAGLKPASVLCELMNPDGSMPNMKQTEEFARANGLVLVSIQDLMELR